jgi:hypothetical protein
MRKLFLTLISLALCPVLVAQQALNNDAIIKLVKSGLSDDFIVSTINGQPGNYDASPDAIVALKNAGASDRVMTAIVQKVVGFSPAAPLPPTPPPVADPIPAPAAKPAAQPPAAATPPTQQAAPVTPPGPHTLLDGTPVKLRLSQTISSADAKVGQEIPFEVVEEVSVDQVVVLPKGATAIATVTEADPKKSMGRAGKLNISISYARLKDQEKVALRATKDTKGGGTHWSHDRSDGCHSNCLPSSRSPFSLYERQRYHHPSRNRDNCLRRGRYALGHGEVRGCSASARGSTRSGRPNSGFACHRLHAFRRRYRNRQCIRWQHPLHGLRRSRKPSDCRQEEGFYRLGQNPQRHWRDNSLERGAGARAAKAVIVPFQAGKRLLPQCRPYVANPEPLAGPP